MLYTVVIKGNLLDKLLAVRIWFTVNAVDGP